MWRRAEADGVPRDIPNPSKGVFPDFGPLWPGGVHGPRTPADGAYLSSPRARVEVPSGVCIGQPPGITPLNLVGAGGGSSTSGLLVCRHADARRRSGPPPPENAPDRGLCSKKGGIRCATSAGPESCQLGVHHPTPRWGFRPNCGLWNTRFRAAPCLLLSLLCGLPELLALFRTRIHATQSAQAQCGGHLYPLQHPPDGWPCSFKPPLPQVPCKLRNENSYRNAEILNHRVLDGEYQYAPVACIPALPHPQPPPFLPTDSPPHADVPGPP